MATPIFDPIANRKKAQKVIVTCYGQRKEFATASKAINFFTKTRRERCRPFRAAYESR